MDAEAGRPFLKVDKGPAAEADGARMIKPIPGMAGLLERVYSGAKSAIKGTVLNAWDDLRHKPYLAAVGTISSTAGELYKVQLDTMRFQAEAMKGQSKALKNHLLNSGAEGIGPDLELSNRAHRSLLNSSKYELKAAKPARGLGSKLPGIGFRHHYRLGIRIDIHNGRPKGEALISGVGGGAAGFAAGAFAGGLASGAATGAAAGSMIPGGRYRGGLRGRRRGRNRRRTGCQRSAGLRVRPRVQEHPPRTPSTREGMAAYVWRALARPARACSSTLQHPFDVRAQHLHQVA